MKEIICICNMVTKPEIQKVINKQGLTTINEIGLATKAGTSCGKCIHSIKEIICKIPRDNRQLKISWD